MNLHKKKVERLITQIFNGQELSIISGILEAIVAQRPA